MAIAAIHLTLVLLLMVRFGCCLKSLARLTAQAGIT